ncbi:MAG: YgdI/YgdR family lipoprotein [Alphaproteobacteria bacterium]|nr:YgdI/YgdR family lipoprotein [Alphaproteobacteria bacterium]
MKKIFAICTLVFALGALAGCSRCEKEPIVAENHKLIVPPNFGNKPAG